jgi:glyoxylase-like metal-dependent hydrolase (beta-lactamase superfamily II)
MVNDVTTNAMQRAFDAAGLQVFERGWLSSNNVLFNDRGSGGESVLIDSGYCTHAAQTVALVKAALAGRSLTRVVNTHLQSVHCGGKCCAAKPFRLCHRCPARRNRQGRRLGRNRTDIPGHRPILPPLRAHRRSG